MDWNDVFIYKRKSVCCFLNSSDIYDTYDCHLYFKCKIGFNIPLNTSYMVGAVITVILTAVFFVKAVKNKNENIEVDVQLEKEAV